jgi:hypothetical protein
MEFELKQYQCDCCGKLTDVLDPDQKLPDGWKVMIPGSDKYKHLCPECTRKYIQESLYKLQKLSEAFNLMGGTLYSGICADEMNDIILTLNETFGIDVEYYQYMPGRVEFTNLKTLIEKYGNKG